MNIILVNPCRPFEGMGRRNDFLEILKTAFVRGFSLNEMAGFVIDEAIHAAYAKRPDVIMEDILAAVMELRGKYGLPLCFELCAKMNCMVSETYAESSAFCQRDGVAVNQLDVYGLKALYCHASNQEVREFLAVLIIHSLMF